MEQEDDTFPSEAMQLTQFKRVRNIFLFNHKKKISKWNL